jgi:hypothetical protein
MHLYMELNLIWAKDFFETIGRSYQSDYDLASSHRADNDLEGNAREQLCRFVALDGSDAE